eukprot:scaffold2113_cov233-Pinguiococcus_pyrenoidosus.AAC.3
MKKRRSARLSGEGAPSKPPSQAVLIHRQCQKQDALSRAPWWLARAPRGAASQRKHPGAHAPWRIRVEQIQSLHRLVRPRLVPTLLAHFSKFKPTSRYDVALSEKGHEEAKAGGLLIKDEQIR